MTSDRRESLRLQVEIAGTQFIDNRPIRSLISNLSASGLHACHIVEPMSRSSRLIQLEIPLPGLEEALWAKGEVVYDSIGPLYHGTGIRFVAMAPHQRRALDRWLSNNSSSLPDDVVPA